MRAMEVKNVPQFMRQLLSSELFDDFYFCEGKIESFASFSIEGQLNSLFYSDDEREILKDRKYALWSEIRPYVYELVKGKNTPLSICITLRLSDDDAGKLLKDNAMTGLGEDLSGFNLNIRYRSSKLQCITGGSYKTFVIDKSLDTVWDEAAMKLLKNGDIEIDVFV